MATGYLTLDGGQFPVVKVAPAGWQVLDGKQTVERRVEPTPSKKATQVLAETPDEAALFEVLRQVRRDLASEQGVPPFVVFSDRSLHEMARQKPQTPAAFLAISGVGQVKLKQYGQLMIDTIESYLAGKDGEDTPAE